MIKFNISEEAKRKLFLTLSITGGILAALYAAFLFILPNVIDLNKYTPMISTEVEKMSGFKFDAQRLKLKTTYRLGVKLAAESISVNYKDDTPLFNLKAPEIEVNIPTILIGHINLDTIKAQNADIYLTFTKDNKYTVMEYVDKIMKASAPQEQAQSADEGFNFPIEIRNINIKADKIALHLFDENVGKTYLTQLDNTVLNLKSLEGPLKLETEGFIGIEGTNTKFLTLNADFKTKFPKAESGSAKTETAEEIEIPEININPFKTLEDFNFRSDINAKLDIKDLDDFKAKGNLDIEKFSLKLADYQLPDSKVNILFKDRDINVNSDIYISKDEFLNLKSDVKTGKKGKLNLDAKSEKITLNSLMNIASAVLKICCVENDLNSIAAQGYITSDFSLNTDYKTINSKGYLKLIDGDINYPKAGIRVSQIGSHLDFSNNNLNIKNTSASVNGAKFEVNGKIAQNADINLNIKSDPLKIKDLVNLAVEFKAVSEKDLADFQFNNGLLSLAINVIGNLNSIQPKADVDLSDFQMLVKSAKMPIGIENIKITARPKGKDDIDATVKVKNVTASMPEPALHFSAPSANLTLDMKNIVIQPLSATLENTKINVSGDVKNYMVNPELNITAKGNIHPTTVLAFIPKEFRSGITYQGAMPYNALIAGTLDNIKITGNVVSNPSNYIGVVDIPVLKGLENSLILDMALKGETLDLNEIAVKSPSAKPLQVKGQVKNIYAIEPVLQNLSVNLPSKTKIIIPMLGNASFTANGGITLNGKAFSPEMTGSISVTGFNYPEFGLTLEDLALNFNKTVMSAKAKNAKVAKSDFSGDANISTNFAKGVVINSLNYNSSFIDSDALIALADKVMQTMPAPAAPAASSTAAADIGVTIKTGQAKIGRLKSGTLFVDNISYDHTLLKNVYALNNLVATFAQGKAEGKCTYNVMNGKIGVDMQAEGISMKDASKEFIGKEIIRSGTLGGKAKLTLSGATYEEQMKTLKGTVSFEVKDGQYGDCISFTRFINAVNVMSLSSLKSALTSANSKLEGADTQAFKDMTGILTFNNGVANVSSFKSQGPSMSLYANGSYNLLNGYTNMKVTGRVSSKIMNFLGVLGTDKIQTGVEKAATVAENAINKATSALNEKLNTSTNKGVQAGLAVLGAIKTAQTGTTAATAQSTSTASTSSTAAKPNAGQVVSTMIKQTANPIFGAISQNDVANVPALTTSDTQNAKNFQVSINGPITNPKAIKSFKFQAVQAEN